MKGVEDKDFGVFRSLALLYAMYSKSKHPTHIGVRMLDGNTS